MQQRQRGDAFATISRPSRRLHVHVGDDVKRVEVRFLQGHLCYSSSIFPSVYKACVICLRLKK
jgi:hypothetical protein